MVSATERVSPPQGLQSLHCAPALNRRLLSEREVRVPVIKGRRLKQHMLYGARSLGLLALARRLTQRSVRVLCYHGTWLAGDGFPGDAMFMRRGTFAARLAAIRRLGYPVITLDAAAEALAGRTRLARASVAITIDDGWLSSHRDMLPELLRHAMPATLYCDTANLVAGRPVVHVMARYMVLIGGGTRLDAAGERALAVACDQARPFDERLAACRTVAAQCGRDLDCYLASGTFDYMSPAQLASAAAAGLDVELHTHNHTMHDLSAAAVASEIERNRQVLAGILSVPASRFRHFCYPSGVCSEAAARAAAQAGITSATTTVQGLAAPGVDMQLIPRLLDGEHLSEIEFEAELSGFADGLRWLRSRARDAAAIAGSVGHHISSIRSRISNDQRRRVTAP